MAKQMTTGGAAATAPDRGQAKIAQSTELLVTEDPARVPAPAWTRDLVIYEVNPRGFTSPDGVGDGHGSGTFRSMAERIPYLSNLGVNAIWLAGFHEATDHFYGIWSAYAANRFDRFDPALGTAQDFGHLVRTAHEHGIRILLEVIAHGVVHDSPIVAEHPDWFLRDGSWGMRDFDYANPEFRAWWSDLWTSYVTDYEVDGFRVDLQLYDVTLWDAIARRAEQAGHPILIMPERGRYHLSQQDWKGLSPDIAADWNANLLRFATHQISCHDNGWSSGPGSYYHLAGSRAKFGYCAFSHRIPLFFAGEEFNATQISLPAVRRGLFGAGGPGGWLYGCQVPWEQLAEDPTRQAFLDDVRHILAIRHAHRDLLNADRWANEMLALTTEPETALVPYARFRFGEKAVIVAGNEDTAPLTVRVRIPLEVFGFSAQRRLRITDAWNGGDTFIDGSDMRDELTVHIGPDNTPLGGLAVLVITPDHPPHG